MYKAIEATQLKQVLHTSFSSVDNCDHLADRMLAISFLLRFGNSSCILKNDESEMKKLRFQNAH
jgi:hypothetical protein